MEGLVPLQKVFEYEGKRVRAIVHNGQPWFANKDACDILGHSNPTMAIADLDEDEKMTLRGRQSLLSFTEDPFTTQLTFVSEAGLYKLIMKSRKPEAKAFQRWVTHEVLPALRTTGHYEVPNFRGREVPKTFLDALKLAVALEEERLALTEEVKELKPKGALFDLFLAGTNAQTMGEVAKVLGTGRTRLFRELRQLGILNNFNVPRQRYIDRGLFAVREVSLARKGLFRNVPQTLVTAKGVEFIARLLRNTA